MGNHILRHRLICMVTALLSLMLPINPTSCKADADADKYIGAVQRYADMILNDACGFSANPKIILFADGLNYYTGEPVKHIKNGVEKIPSDLANQQLVMRMLAGLTDLTGDAKYKNAAKAQIQYYFKNLNRNGLLVWGSHRYLDLNSGSFTGEQDMHELKNVYPYYDLMYETNAEATSKYIESYWNGAVTDWELLAFNRHSPYNKVKGAIWDSTYKGTGDPNIGVDGLPFINAGSDMMYAAAKYIEYTGNNKPRAWIDRMLTLYANARNPITKVGGHQYGILKSGDRAALQLGDDFGEKALEMNFAIPSTLREYYGISILGLMQIADTLNDDNLKDYAVESMEAFYDYVYDSDNNRIHTMFTDGEKLTNYRFSKDGYYGSAGTYASSSAPDLNLVYSSVLMACRSNSEKLWNGARKLNMKSGQGIGDIGVSPGAKPTLSVSSYNPEYLLMAIELYKRTNNPEFLNFAKDFADRMLEFCFEDNRFRQSSKYVNVKLNRLEPIALLKLAATLNNVESEALNYYANDSYIHDSFDGYGRTYDKNAIYGITQSFPMSSSKIITNDTFNGYLRDSQINGHGGFEQQGNNLATIVYKNDSSPNVNDLALNIPEGEKITLNLREPVPLNCIGKMVIQFEVKAVDNTALNIELEGSKIIGNTECRINSNTEYQSVSAEINKNTGKIEVKSDADSQKSDLDIWNEGFIEKINISATKNILIDNLFICERENSGIQPQYLVNLDFEEKSYTNDENGKYLFSSPYGTSYKNCVITPLSNEYAQGGESPLYLIKNGESYAPRFTDAGHGIEIRFTEPVDLAKEEFVFETDFASNRNHARMKIDFIDDKGDSVFVLTGGGQTYQVQDKYGGGTEFDLYKVGSVFEKLRFEFKSSSDSIYATVDGRELTATREGGGYSIGDNPTLKRASGKTKISAVRMSKTNVTMDARLFYFDNIKAYTKCEEKTVLELNRQGNTFLADAIVNMEDSNEKNIFFVFAHYGANDALLGMKVKKVSLEQNMTNHLAEEYALDGALKTGEYVRAYIWNYNLKPIATAKVNE